MKKFYTSKLKDIKDIKERNNIFNNVLSDEDKRKEIAWDALNLLLLETIAPSHMSYWSNNFCKRVENLSSKLLQKELLSLKPKENCVVCARGAMTLSQIRLGNEVSSEGYYGGFYEAKSVSDIASGDEIQIKGFNYEDYLSMEEAYEGFEGTKYIYPSNTKENLACIFCNIIVNGNFNIKDKTDYLIKYNIKL